MREMHSALREWGGCRTVLGRLTVGDLCTCEKSEGPDLLGEEIWCSM